MAERKLVGPIIHPLTSLRAFAAIWVACVHITMGGNDSYLPEFSDKVDWGAFDRLINYGLYAVDIFFILSGFIISYAYSASMRKNMSFQTLKNFYVSRFARLYPLTFVVTCLLFATYLTGTWTPEWEINSSKFLCSIFFLNIFDFVSCQINPPAWSISAEFFAYLSFPLIMLLLPGKKGALTYVLSIIVLSLLYGTVQELYTYLTPENVYWQHSNAFALFRVLLGFLIGCVLYALYKTNYEESDTRQARRNEKAFWAVILSLLVLLTVLPSALLVYPLFPWLIYTLACAGGVVKKFFSLPFIVYLGKISFSIYIVHIPVSEIFRAFLHDTYAALDPATDQILIWGHFVVILSAVIGVAAIGYHMVEDPARRYIKSRLKD
jgi:peptidoglycan/LPS O-acetylase OafA/YrhL